ALAAQGLRRFLVVVRTLQRTALVALFAHLAGMGAAAAGDVVELRQVPVAHLDGLVAVVDDEKSRHGHSGRERASCWKASSSARTACSGLGQGSCNPSTAPCKAPAKASQAAAGQGDPTRIRANSASAVTGMPSAS